MFALKKYGAFVEAGVAGSVQKKNLSRRQNVSRKSKMTQQAS